MDSRFDMLLRNAEASMKSGKTSLNVLLNAIEREKWTTNAKLELYKKNMLSAECRTRRFLSSGLDEMCHIVYGSVKVKDPDTGNTMFQNGMVSPQSVNDIYLPRKRNSQFLVHAWLQHKQTRTIIDILPFFSSPKGDDLFLSYGQYLKKCILLDTYVIKGNPTTLARNNGIYYRAYNSYLMDKVYRGLGVGYSNYFKEGQLYLMILGVNLRNYSLYRKLKLTISCYNGFVGSRSKAPKKCADVLKMVLRKWVIDGKKPLAESKASRQVGMMFEEFLQITSSFETFIYKVKRYNRRDYEKWLQYLKMCKLTVEDLIGEFKVQTRFSHPKPLTSRFEKITS